MGRDSTGVYSTGECLRIELSSLFKTGLIRKGSIISGTLSWTVVRSGENAGNISVYSNLTGSEYYIELSYTTTYRNTGEKKDFKYKVFIEAVPSNLGKGEVLYFLCPETGQRCRILYKAYGCDIWKCREAYTHRIYYDLQQCSKLDRYNTKYWALDKQLFKQPKKRINSTYKGQKTKRAIKREKMVNELCRMDELRWSPAGVPKKLWAAVREMGYGQ